METPEQEDNSGADGASGACAGIQQPADIAHTGCATCSFP